jgi:glycosyltransferase involved in cell wall biosynthesis
MVADPRSATEGPVEHPLSVAIYMHDLTPGGVERQCLTLARELQARGLDITLVLHRAEGELHPLLPQSLPVVDLRSRRTLQDIPLLASYLRRARPDVLLANVDHNNLAALLAKAMARVETAVITCQHNSLAPGFNGGERWTYRWIPLGYRLLAPFGSAMVAVSAGISAELADLAGIRAENIVTINNPALDEGFAERAGAPGEHPWLVDRNGPLFVTAGRLVPQKDHETLLRGFAAFRAGAPGRLLILGDGPLRPRLEATVSALGIGEWVQFLGFVANPLPYVREADAFVLTSRSEGFGNVLVEALGCGTPVIATDCPHGPAEILDRGRCGVLVPPGDGQALAIALAGATALRDRYPAAMLKARAAEFSAAACAARYHALFRSLSGRRAGGARRMPAARPQKNQRVAT